MDELRIRRPDDFHVHLRDDPMLSQVVHHTAHVFARALVMPNLIPPIATGSDAVLYSARINWEVGEDEFKPLMTIKLLKTTTPAIIRTAHQMGVVAAKFYPEGVTTNSADGLEHPLSIESVLRVMEQIGMVLCLHAEAPGVFCLERELAFHDIIQWLWRTFPKLKIVVEHVTDARTVELITDHAPPTVAATITVHHLLLTLDDVIGAELKPHHFCKPVAKQHKDRKALLKVATSGHPRFFLGTDSAPHSIEKKECACGAAGIFTAPVAMPLLATIFEREGALSNLESFTSENGAEFYGLPLNEGTLTLVRDPWVVPDVKEGVIPFWMGREIAWKAIRSRCPRCP
jgi:dihydroorotase